MRLILFLIILFCFQSILPSVGAKPDLFLIAVVILSLRQGTRQGMLVGFIFGLIQDIVSGGIYLHVFTKTILGWLTNVIKNNFESEEDVLSVILVIIFTPLVLTCEWLVLYLYYGKAFPFFSIIFFATLYNALLTPLIHYGIRKST